MKNAIIMSWTCQQSVMEMPSICHEQCHHSVMKMPSFCHEKCHHSVIKKLSNLDQSFKFLESIRSHQGSIRDLPRGFQTHSSAKNQQNHNFSFLRLRNAMHDLRNTIPILPEAVIWLKSLFLRSIFSPPPPPPESAHGRSP